MENDPNTTVSIFSILKWIAGIITTFVVGFSLHSIKIFKGRIKDSEDRITDLELQRAVDNTSFEDYKIYKDLKDKELNLLLGKIETKIGRIFTKIENLKDNFDDKFNRWQELFDKKLDAIQDSVVDLKVQNARNTGK